MVGCRTGQLHHSVIPRLVQKQAQRNAVKDRPRSKRPKQRRECEDRGLLT